MILPEDLENNNFLRDVRLSVRDGFVMRMVIGADGQSADRLIKVLFCRI